MFDYKKPKYRIAQMQVDNMGKKPIRHFLPDSNTFTIGLFGCDFRCAGCINFEISQVSEKDNEFVSSIEENDYRSAEEICDLAQKYNCPSITFSFTEPTIWSDYALYVAEEAHRRGLKTVWKSNGYQTSKIIHKMVGLIDAANIDLKFFSDKDYAAYCGPGIKLDPVLKTIEGLHAAGIHVEVSTILMPSMNEDELVNIATWLAKLDPNIPWHVNRYHNMYLTIDKWDDRPKFSSDEIVQLGKRCGLNFVYPFELRGWKKEY